MCYQQFIQEDFDDPRTLISVFQQPVEFKWLGNALTFETLDHLKRRFRD